MPLSPTESWTLMGLVFATPFLPAICEWLARVLRGGDDR